MLWNGCSPSAGICVHDAPEYAGAALGPVANTDTKLLIYGLFQKGRVLAQDGILLLFQRSAVFMTKALIDFSAPESSSAWLANFSFASCSVILGALFFR